MPAVGSRQLLAGIGSEYSCTGRCAHDAAGRIQLGQDRDERLPEAADCVDPAPDRTGHALGVDVDQDECRVVEPVNDMVGRPGDQVRGGGAVQLLEPRLRRDLHLGGQVIAQGTEGDRLMRRQAADTDRECSEAIECRTLRTTGRHDARGPVAVECAVGCEADPLG